MVKYIFLDFDGVLNTEFYQNLLISQGKPWGDENGAFFDPEAVMQLKRIVDATCADIIIESSWKYLIKGFKGDVGSTPIAWTFDRHHSVYSQ